MNFTFGIITNAYDGVNDHLIEVIDSIHRQKIPHYEIVVVGTKGKLQGNVPGPVTIVDWDETRRARWITAKKNAITYKATYENIVYQHDYVVLCDGWYDGWQKFGNDYALCMNPILNKDGTRYRDWVMFPHPYAGGPSLINQARAYAGSGMHECLLPYTEVGFSKLQYFSGAYWVGKKEVMKKVPLDEKRAWGDGEDVEWSYRARVKYKFSINPHSKVQLLKQKNPTFTELKPAHLNRMREFLKQRNLYG